VTSEPAELEPAVSQDWASGWAEGVGALRDADPVMRAIIDEVGTDGLEDFRTGLPSDSYATLIRAIAGQQLSNRAAAAIYDKLLARYGGRPPAPAELLADDPEELRVAAGLSHAKVLYLRSLAEHVLDGSLDLDHLDEERPDVPDHPSAPARRAAGRRPRDPQGGDEPLRVAGAARAGRGHRDRRAVAAVSDAREPVFVAVAVHDAGVSAGRAVAPAGRWRRQGGGAGGARLCTTPETTASPTTSGT
jgi:hypothetical protein